jgi:hypothetical protein
METNRVFYYFINQLEKAIEEFPDIRTGNNAQFYMRDAAFGAYSAFHMQSPSFLSHQNYMQEKHGKNNAKTIFQIDKIPGDNHIRNMLDPVSPSYLYPVYLSVFEWLLSKGTVDDFRYLNNNLLIPLDGTSFFSSNEISCSDCTVKEHSGGKISYSHSVITPALVSVGKTQVIPLPQEFITPQDGHDKQDCENAAAKRWLKEYGSFFAPLGTTILGDDLYSRQPVCQAVLNEGLNFIFFCKSSSHTYLTEWISDFDPKNDLNEFTIKRWNGKERYYDTYRFRNNVPLKDGEDALIVNWAELVITNKEGKRIKHFAFVTNHEITRNNIYQIVEAGRCRWKIENENNNVLKTKGYHIEHNFGHGKKYLANFLLSLNILSFLCHTLLELFDKRYALLRKTLSRRRKFFADIVALTTYICFEGWNELLIFMIKGLELLDPG